MSRTLRLPVFLWRTQERVWSGRLLDDLASFGTACGTSPQAVLRDLKSYLQGADTSSSIWVPDPDFLEPQVRVIKIQAIPEYETVSKTGHGRTRTLPCAEPVTLKLPCLTGTRTSGLTCLMIPALNVEVELSGPDNVEEMALHYARQVLKGLTPAQMLRLLPPLEWKLDTISFTPRQRTGKLDDQPLKVLQKVAEHAASPSLRRTSRTWERDADVADLETRLRQSKGCVLLVGESGCGKTAVLIEAARRVERQTGERGPQKKRFWITSGARLIAGMRWLGQWQEQIEEVIEDLRRIDGILAVESLQELMRLGGDKPESSVAAFLIPYLKSGELRLVVEATPVEVEACERMLPGFLDAFSTQRLLPLTAAQGDRVLQLAAQSLSAGSSLEFSLEAARDAGRLRHRFQPYAGFPGLPIGLMNEAAARAREAGSREVTLADIRRLFGESTGLPGHLLDEEVRLDPQQLHQWFSERLISQPSAVQAVCKTVLKFKAGLQDPRRPLAVLLFAGPTGTGKTQLAKVLGDYLFPNRKVTERLVRLDMSEYGGHDAARRLLGDAFGEPSDLVKRLRQNPFTVLLLDEVEKAAPEVFDTLMNVFDEGRLTDALGRSTWFRSCVIIMTSNLGTQKGGSLGFGMSDSVEGAKSDAGAITRFFRPEFFNRLDQVVSFEPLGRIAIEDIGRREIGALAAREGLSQKGITLEVEDALVKMVCQRGFDPVYGARPLQRRIEEWIVTPLACWLAAHPAGKDMVLALKWNAEETRVEISPKPRQA